MAPDRNGTVAAAETRTAAYLPRPPLRTTAETIPYQLEGPDGETITFSGYKRAGCPLDIYLEWLRVEAEAEPIQPTLEDRTALTPTAYLAKLMAAEGELRRGYLMAVIPGLRDPGYANAVNVLAGQDGQYLEILTELGWWTAPEADAAAEDDAGPEADGAAPSTSGRAGSPASLPATASTPSAAPQEPA